MNNKSHAMNKLPEDILHMIAEHLTVLDIIRGEYEVVVDLASLISTAKTYSSTCRLVSIMQDLIDPGCLDASFDLRNSAEYALRKSNDAKSALEKEYRVLFPFLKIKRITKKSMICHLTQVATRRPWQLNELFKRYVRKNKMLRVKRKTAEGIFKLRQEDLAALQGVGPTDLLLIHEVRKVASDKIKERLEYSGDLAFHPLLLEPDVRRFRLESLANASVRFLV
jgi:hypothetical protein